MNYPLSSIKIINGDNLIFLDEQNNERIINLRECAMNRIQYINKYQDKITSESSKCVGQRDWSAEIPYYEFFTIPYVKFVLDYKRSLLRKLLGDTKYNNYAEFRKITRDLEAAGWTTLDLS